MKIENLRGVYREIAMETDIETAKAMHKLFGGQQISFPKKIFNNDYMNTYIKEKKDTQNTRELAHKFNVSERRIRQILNKFK